MPGLGTGLKGRLRKIARKTADKPSKDFYPAWINADLEQKYQMRDRWEAHWAPIATGARVHPRHPLLYESLTSPGWNTDDWEMSGGLISPEERDPFLDLRLVEFVLSLPPMPWLYKKHILREGLSSLLPKAITERQKQSMGLLANSLKQQTGFNTCLPSSDVQKYVNGVEFRKVTTRKDTPALDYLNLRPLVLAQWLQML
jgi:asparagine synthase (glutamine-hydrolysing)